MVGEDEETLYLCSGARVMPRQQRTQTDVKEVVLFSKTSGIMDNVEDSRVGEEGLVRAENVVIDITGALARRGGRTLLDSGVWHSLFSCGSYGLGVKNGVLSTIDGNYNVVSLATIGSRRVRYVKIFDGSDDVIYYSNGEVVGKVVNRVHSAWTTGAYVGINSTESQVIEWLPAPPNGCILELFNGRLFIAADNLIYVSEIRDYSRYRVIPFVFSSKVVMLSGVETGLYVGTLGGDVWFLAGASPFEFTFLKCYDKGVVEGSDVKVMASEIGMPGHNVVVFVVSGEGICLGDGSGNVTNLTSVVVDFPESTFGASYVTGDKQYIVSLH